MFYYKTAFLSNVARQSLAKRIFESSINTNSIQLSNKKLQPNGSSSPASGTIQQIRYRSHRKSIGTLERNLFTASEEPRLSHCTNRSLHTKSSQPSLVESKVSQEHLTSAADQKQGDSGAQNASQVKDASVQATDTVLLGSGLKLFPSNPLSQIENPENAIINLDEKSVETYLEDMWASSNADVAIETAYELFCYMKTAGKHLLSSNLFSEIIKIFTMQNEDSTNDYDLRRLLAIYSYMKQENIPCSQSIYRIILHKITQACAIMQDNTMQFLREKGHAQFDGSYYIFGMNKKDSSLLDMMLKIYSNAIEEGQNSIPVQYFVDSMTILRNSNKAEECLELFQLFEKSSLYQHDIRIFSLLVEAFGEAGDLKTAMDCYTEFKSVAHLVETDDFNRIYSSVLQANLKCKNLAGASSLFNKLTGEWLLPHNLVASYIKELIIQGYDAEAKKHLENYRPSKTNPIYFTALLAFSKIHNMKEATLLYDELKGLLVNDSSGDYTLLRRSIYEYITALIETGDIETAQKVYGDMYSSYLRVNPHLAFLFANAYAEREQKENLTLLFKQIFLQSVWPIRDQYYSLLLSHFLNFMIQRDWLPLDLNLKLQNVVLYKVDTKTLFTPGATHVRKLSALAYRQIILLSGQKRLPSKDAEDLIVLLAIFTKLSLHQITFPVSVPKEDYSFDLSRERAEGSSFQEQWNEIRPQVVDLMKHAMKYAKPKKLTQLQLYYLSNIAVYGDSELHGVISDWLAANHISLDQESVAQNYDVKDISIHRCKIPAPENVKIEQGLSSRIRALTRKSDPDEVDEFVRLTRYVISNNIFLDPSLYPRVIEKLGKIEKQPMGHAFYEMTMRHISQFSPMPLFARDWLEAWIYNNMIIVYSSEYNAGKVIECQEKMAQRGYCPNANSYGSMIHYLPTLESDQAKIALGLFQEAKANRVVPSVFMYNTLIAKLAKCRIIQECVHLVDEMRQIGLKPTTVTYSSVLYGALRADRLDVADDMIREIEKLQNEKMTFSAYPFNMLIQFYAQKNMREEAQAVFDRLAARTNNIPPLTFRYLMDAYVKKPADLHKIQEIQDLMRKMKVSIDSIHFIPLIEYHKSKKDFDSAYQIYKDVISSYGRNAVSEQVFQSISEAAKVCGRLDAISEIVKNMEELKVSMNAYIANNLIGGYASAGHLNDAKRIFQSLPFAHGKKGREPSTYKLLVQALVDAGDLTGAADLISEMNVLGFPKKVVDEIEHIYVTKQTDYAQFGL